MLLQRQPNQKAAELAAELGISVRTLHRYVEILDEMGIPIYSERGPHGGFSLVRGYKMPPLVFTPSEAVALYLGIGVVGELWGSLYEEAARGAMAKLDNVLPEIHLEEVAWARRTMVAMAITRPTSNALGDQLALLRQALREERTVHMAYQGQQRSEPVMRDVDPYALVHGYGWWYVVGYCHLRRHIRQFRVDRMRQLKLLDHTFRRPADFDAREFMDTERMSQGISVRMRFDAATAALARHNRAYWDSLVEADDGSVVVEFSSPELEWAAATVLAYGPAVEVLEPAVLRDLVRQRASAVAARYRQADA